MRRIFWSLFVLPLIIGTSCQEKVDIEKEKAAIIAVLEEDTEAFFDSDIDRLSAVHVQDETNIRLTATKSGYTYEEGWEEVESFFRDYFENEAQPGEFYEVKRNYKIKVYGESAWAVFDNDFYNEEDELLSTSIHAEFLEKVNGKWKIVFYTSIYTSTWEDEEDNETQKADGEM